MEPAAYNPRVVFPVEHIFLEKTICIPDDTDALVTKYDDAGNYIALGCKDGSVRVISNNDKSNTSNTQTQPCTPSTQRNNPQSPASP